jgi:hypothetical protein
MTSLDAWKRATTSKTELTPAKVLFLIAVFFATFATVSLWPIWWQSFAFRAFFCSAIVCGIPGGFILLACRASHGPGQARSALGGVLILIVVLFLFALLF